VGLAAKVAAHDPASLSARDTPKRGIIRERLSPGRNRSSAGEEGFRPRETFPVHDSHHSPPARYGMKNLVFTLRLTPDTLVGLG
jgi:hypothetical protein